MRYPWGNTHNWGLKSQRPGLTTSPQEAIVSHTCPAFGKVLDFLHALATMLELKQWMSNNRPIEWVSSQHVCLLSMAHRVVTKLWLPNVTDGLNYATQHASCIIKVSTWMCNFGTLKHRVSFADSQGLFPHTTWSVLGVLAQTVIRRPLLCLCESAVAADMWAAAWDTRKRPKLQRLPWAEPPAPRHCLLFSPC